MKRLSNDKDEGWSPDSMIATLESFSDKPLGKVWNPRGF
jgi:hypothetical protein